MKRWDGFHLSVVYGRKVSKSSVVCGPREKLMEPEARVSSWKRRYDRKIKIRSLEGDDVRYFLRRFADNASRFIDQKESETSFHWVGFRREGGNGSSRMGELDNN